MLVTGEFSTSSERKEGWWHADLMSLILEAMEVTSAVITLIHPSTQPGVLQIQEAIDQG